MVEGVKEQIEKERQGRIKKREKEKQFRRRNQDILETQLPAIRDAEYSDEDESSSLSLGRQVGSVAKRSKDIWDVVNDCIHKYSMYMTLYRYV